MVEVGETRERERSGAARPLRGSPVARLQPTSSVRILDIGFEVLKFRTRSLALVGVAVGLPLLVIPSAVATWLNGTLRAGRLTGVDWMEGGSGTGAAISAIVEVITPTLASMLMGFLMAVFVGAWLVGVDVSVGAALARLRQRGGTVIGAYLLAMLLKVCAGVACGVGLAFVVPVLGILGPVLAMEDHSAVDSVRRAFRLGRPRWMALLGLSLLWLVVANVLSAAPPVAASLMRSLLGDDTAWAVVVGESVSMAFSVLLLCVQAAVAALLYVDLRVRREGLDLALAASEAFDDLG